MTKKDLLIEEAARIISRSNRVILVEQEADKESWKRETLERLNTPSRPGNMSPYAEYMQRADWVNGQRHPDLTPHKQHIKDAVTKAIPEIVDNAYNYWSESHKNFLPSGATEGEKKRYRQEQRIKIVKDAFDLADKHLPKGLPHYVHMKASDMLVGISIDVDGLVPKPPEGSGPGYFGRKSFMKS